MRTPGLGRLHYERILCCGGIKLLRVIAVGGMIPVMFAGAVFPANAGSHRPPPDRVVIDVVTANGTGCKPKSTAVAVSPDNTAFTVTYSDYLAQVGVGAKPADSKKRCNLNLRVRVPQGFTYAVAQADYRGFAHLE